MPPLGEVRWRRAGEDAVVQRGLIAAASLASGVMLWLASPSVGLGWLAWGAIVPVACIALAPWPRARTRWAVPAAYFVWLQLAIVPDLPPGIAEDQWGDPLLPLVADTPAPLVALLVLPAFALALAAAGFGRAGPAARLPGVLGTLALVAAPTVAWTALEVVEVRAAPGGWWATLAATQHGSAGAALAALGGPYVITLCLVAVNYALALALLHRTAATVAGAALLAVVVAVGAALAPVRDGEGGLVIAAVQPGYDTAEDRPATEAFERDDYGAAAGAIIADLEPMTRAAARRGARVVAWPEAVIWVDPVGSRQVRERLEDLARELSTAIVVSYFLPEPATSAVLLATADGELSEAVPKQHPMWYLGEAGRGAGPPRSLPSDGTRVGVMPGVDNEDPGVARRLVADGARVLVSVTHDWQELAVQQRAFASLHAVSTGVPLVRSDWRYGAGVWDSGGRLVAGDTVRRERKLVIASVAPGDPTPYVAVGDVVGDAAVILALLLGGAAVLDARRPSRVS